MSIHFIPNCEQPFTEFVFMPDSLRFGADPQLTVITGYLYPNEALMKLVMPKIPMRNPLMPTAYILCYDAEHNNISLYFIDEADGSHIIPIDDDTKKTLYATLAGRVEQIYGYSPKEVLNIIRGYADLSLLP